LKKAEITENKKQYILLFSKIIGNKSFLKRNFYYYYNLIF